MAFFKVNAKLFWIAFTLFFFFLYLAKESISIEVRSFFIANIFTYLLVALRALHSFYNNKYYLSSEKSNNQSIKKT